MTTPALERILRAPARLCVGPTNLALSWPHGGTELGAVGGLSLTPGWSYVAVPDEAQREIQAVYRTACRPVLRALFYQPYDALAVSHLWPGSSTGATTGEPLISLPSSSTPTGSSLTASIVLVEPHDTTSLPCVILRAALPTIARESRLLYDPEHDHVLVAEWECKRDASERLISIGWLGDLSL